MKKNDLKFMPEFYDRYINLVSDNTILIEGLKATQNDYHAIEHLLEKHQDYKYEKDKWTPKDILQHVVDCERILSYRALALSRDETTPLPGFDQDIYARHTDASNRSIKSLLQEYKSVRNSSVLLFESLPEHMLFNEGTCSGIKITPLALGFVNIGHGTHHLNVLHERYF